jgi:hypothetical protein
MNRIPAIEIKYPEIGVCGLSCRLCPTYHTESASRCSGCKSESRIGVGCPFITCAVKKKSIEFCWDCEESTACDKWKKHRDAGKQHDSFKCYQKLEYDIHYIQEYGVEKFEVVQKQREQLLTHMLNEFNEGRSKSYYCIAATVLEIEEMKEAIYKARKGSTGLDKKAKSKFMHSLLDAYAKKNNYCLKLRK